MQTLEQIPDCTPEYINSTFELHLEEAYDRARNIVSSRHDTRDAIPIWQKMAFGVHSIVTFIFHKACRLVSMIQAQEHWADGVETGSDYFGRLKELQLLDEKIDDELLDIMNYAAFALAYRKTYRLLTNQEDSGEHQRLSKTS